MNLLGVHLTLLIGPTVAIPAPPPLTEALDSVQVTHSDKGRSGFQLTFQVGRSGPLGMLDYPLALNPLLRPFNRVILLVTLNAIPRVLMDGIITHQQLSPSNEPGASTLTVTGEDVSVMMDQEEVTAEHPAQDETIIALKLILGYAQYGLLPMVLPPGMIDFPIPLKRIPAQRGTDLKYIKELAQRHGYVFYIIPGPVPFANIAYWGPLVRLGLPQKALSVNMGATTNVESINFQHNALQPTFVSGSVQESDFNISLPIRTFFSFRLPLSSQPTWLFHMLDVRTVLPDNTSRLSYLQSFARAQAKTEASMDEVVTATGELDASRYGDLLSPRGLVGLRGVGYTYDGIYYVKKVTHKIKRGEYKQSFTLTREGVGSTVPLVRP